MTKIEDLEWFCPQPFMNTLVYRTVAPQPCCVLKEWPKTSIKQKYETTDPKGNSVIASGAIYIPVKTDNEPLSLISGQHGLTIKRSDVASVLPLYGYLGVFGAGIGYAVIQPDYLGLGSSTFPYYPVYQKTNGKVYKTYQTKLQSSWGAASFHPEAPNSRRPQFVEKGLGNEKFWIVKRYIQSGEEACACRQSRQKAKAGSQIGSQACKTKCRACRETRGENNRACQRCCSRNQRSRKWGGGW